MHGTPKAIVHNRVETVSYGAKIIFYYGPGE